VKDSGQRKSKASDGINAVDYGIDKANQKKNNEKEEGRIDIKIKLLTQGKDLPDLFYLIKESDQEKD